MKGAIIAPSTSILYGTPPWLYAWLDARFAFTYDPCPLNDAKIWDSLLESWTGHRVYCNPPYGREIGKWLAKRFEPDLSVYLLPARTDTAWWHELVMDQAREVVFFQNRISFVGMKNLAPFPSVVLIYEGQPRPTVFKSVKLQELEKVTRGYSL